MAARLYCQPALWRHTTSCARTSTISSNSLSRPSTIVSTTRSSRLPSIPQSALLSTSTSRQTTQTPSSPSSLFVPIPNSFRTRLASPVPPGLPSYLSTPLDQNGLKFGIPDMASVVGPGQDVNFKHRGETAVEQAAKFIMRDGKLSVARRYMNYVLNYLRQSSPPKYSPENKHLLRQPPAESLPRNPVDYFSLAVDSVAPLLRIKSVKGAGGGGQALQLPVPVNQRQRRRIALKWLVDAANRRQNSLSGKNTFAHRFAVEVVAIIEGRSTIWQKREMLHKEAVMNRANMNSMKLKKHGRRMR